MDTKNVPNIFLKLQSVGCISASDILSTADGFWIIYKSLSDILAEMGVFDFPASDGTRLACNKFYDDWYLYAVPGQCDYTYSLLKMREQEFDADSSAPADGDSPGVTISFISFDGDTLLECIADQKDENRKRLDCEINRVVARRGQTHHKNLKKYFIDPKSEGAYLALDLYTKYIASYAKNGFVSVPEAYKAISNKKMRGHSRLCGFIESVNQSAGYIVCDNDKIYVQNKDDLTEYERAVIVATHTGNTSEYSFAAEVEFHARFLSPLAKIKIPLLGRSPYDSAIRADMSVDDKEFAGPAPFYKSNSKIVKRQYKLHRS